MKTEWELLVAEDGPDRRGNVWPLEQIKTKMDALIASDKHPVVIAGFDYGRPVAELLSTELRDGALYATVDVRDEQMVAVLNDEDAGHWRISYASFGEGDQWELAAVALVAAEKSLWP